MSTSNLASAASDMATNTTAKLLHPYYPLDTALPNWTANEWSVPALLSVFFGACTLLFTSTYFVAKRLNKNRDLSPGQLLTIMWFVLSGSIHLFFEGYYAANYATLSGKQTLIGQMWKEYAFSDSRYLTNNSFVLCMETVTAVCWGPGCLMVAFMIMTRHPLRYPIQMIVSMGQFYGDALYYATSAFDHYIMGISYSRPDSYYFWGYFVLTNAFWIVIPGCKSHPYTPPPLTYGDGSLLTVSTDLIYQSATESAKAISKAQRLDATKKAS